MSRSWEGGGECYTEEEGSRCVVVEVAGGGGHALRGGGGPGAEAPSVTSPSAGVASAVAKPTATPAAELTHAALAKPTNGGIRQHTLPAAELTHAALTKPRNGGVEWAEAVSAVASRGTRRGRMLTYADVCRCMLTYADV